MNKLILLGILSSFFAVPVLAKTLPFSENQTIPVALSNTNINRLVVSNDQITHVICPTNACMSKHDNNDSSGSVYVSVLINDPFTLFVSTENGHHVSLSVTSVKSDGKTLVLNPLGANQKAQTWETESSYRTILMNLARDMMNNIVPDGYGFSEISGSSWKKVFNGDGKMKMEALWSGNYLMGIEYVFKNTSAKSLTLPESAFYHQGIRLVATSKEIIAKGDTETVYEIISRQP